MQAPDPQWYLRALIYPITVTDAGIISRLQDLTATVDTTNLKNSFYALLDESNAFRDLELRLLLCGSQPHSTWLCS